MYISSRIILLLFYCCFECETNRPNLVLLLLWYFVSSDTLVYVKRCTTDAFASNHSCGIQFFFPKYPEQQGEVLISSGRSFGSFAFLIVAEHIDLARLFVVLAIQRPVNSKGRVFVATFLTAFFAFHIHHSWLSVGATDFWSLSWKCKHSMLVATLGLAAAVYHIHHGQK